jgi:hypothetical protein
MERSKRFLVSLLLFIGFSAAGYSAGETLSNLQKEGRFSNWEQMRGELRFDQIADATPQIIWAKTVDGALYSWDTNCAREPSCNQWIQTDEIPTDIHEYNEPPLEKKQFLSTFKFGVFHQPARETG